MKTLLLSALLLFPLAARGGSLDPEPSSVVISGQVLSKTEDGLLIYCAESTKFGKARAKGIVYLIGASGFQSIADDDQVEELGVELNATFSYRAVSGAAKSVRAYLAPEVWKAHRDQYQRKEWEERTRRMLGSLNQPVDPAAAKPVGKSEVQPSAATSSATTPEESKARAIKKFPALAVAGSPFNAAFVAEYKRLQEKSDPLLRDPRHFEILADRVAQMLLGKK